MIRRGGCSRNAESSRKIAAFDCAHSRPAPYPWAPALRPASEGTAGRPDASAAGGPGRRVRVTSRIGVCRLLCRVDTSVLKMSGRRKRFSGANVVRSTHLLINRSKSRCFRRIDRGRSLGETADLSDDRRFSTSIRLACRVIAATKTSIVASAPRMTSSSPGI